MMMELKPLRLLKELKKIQQIRKGVIFGLEVAPKNVGVAVSDGENKVALPWSHLSRPVDGTHGSYLQMMQELKQPLLAVVVGYPYVNQANNPNAFHVNEFTQELSNSSIFGDIPYTFWDSSFASKTVELALRPLNIPPEQAKEYVDVFAAVSNLQGYLDYYNKEA